MSYRRKLILVFTLITIIPLTLAYSFFYFRFYSTQRDLIISGHRAHVENSTLNLNTTLSEHLRQLQIIRRHPRLQHVLRSPIPLSMSISLFDFYVDFQNLHHAFGGASPFWRLMIYSLNPNVLSGTFIRDAGMMDSHALEMALANPWAEYILTASECLNYLYMLKPETTLQGQIYAIAQVSLSFERVRQYFIGDYPEGTQIFLLISQESTSPINLYGGSQIYDPDDYFMFSVPLLSSSAIMGYIPGSYLAGRLLNPLIGLTAGYIILMLMFAFLTIFISRLLSRRLEGLLGRVSHDIDKLIKDDGFLTEKGSDEFARIDNKFKELVMEIKRYYEENARMETENKALELEFLQSMINPHFLYNSLGSIKSAYNDKQLAVVVDALIKYYRIALNRGNSLLRIAQEIEMVGRYIEIQKFAYEADFQYEVRMEEGIEELYMPKNILQPLVENALMHGIKRRPGDRVEITGRFDGEYILLTVSDNGAGMAPERLESVMAGINTDLRVGYGLYNVMKRVKLFYGDECGLEIESTKGLGTTASLRITPILTHPK